MAAASSYDTGGRIRFLVERDLEEHRPFLARSQCASRIFLESNLVNLPGLGRALRSSKCRLSQRHARTEQERNPAKRKSAPARRRRGDLRGCRPGVWLSQPGHLIRHTPLSLGSRHLATVFTIRAVDAAALP